MDKIIQQSKDTFAIWSRVPAPERGQLMRQFGQLLRENKERLAWTITQDMGKTIRESRGEVQEVIDMCDFAVGLSRQLYGLTMPSERAGHRIQETWQPLGVVGVITAFNFPMAVWAWNFCLAAVCGNTVIWKPSEKAQNTAAFTHELWRAACGLSGRTDLECVNQIYLGGATEALSIAEHADVALVSATGSVTMGKSVNQVVARRLGKVLLELGGNNASIISQHADLDLAIRGCVFSATGTTGQRCTSLRRLIVHESIYNLVLDKLSNAYRTLKIGDPAVEDVLLGPLVSKEAYDKMQTAIKLAQMQGGHLIHGGSVVDCSHTTNATGPCVMPAIIATKNHLPIMNEETFAPIVYVIPYTRMEEAIDLVNCVPQGLSASIYTRDLNEAEQFLAGSYTGMANVNTSTSGAEIGGAFGGEKESGIGRESGSDSWRQYMRRVTTTINYSGELPLAQGIKFE